MEFARRIPRAEEILDKIATVNLSEIRGDPWFVEYKPTESTNLESKAPYYLCNIVLQGGGMHGAAHVGFICGLEHARIRFAGIAGASAGSIVGIGLACIRKRDFLKPSGAELYELIAKIRPDTFIDGPRPIRKLIKALLRRPTIATAIGAGGLFDAYQRMLTRRGLNPGDAFENWLAETLFNLGVPTIDVLTKEMRMVDEEVIKHFVDADRDGNKRSPNAGSTLKLIAAALPIGLKFEFPKDLSCLVERYGRMNPALLVRASMAVPAFFDPVAFDVRRGAWETHINQKFEGLSVKDIKDEMGKLDRIYMVDGGAFSNLPLDAFLSENKLPTVAVTLIQAPRNAFTWRSKSLRALLTDAGLLFNGIKAQRDRDFWNQLADKSRVRIADVDTTGYNWLNFMMTDEDIQDLFVKGLERALSFLEEIHQSR